MDYNLQNLDNVKELMGDAFDQLAQIYVKNMQIYAENITQGFAAQDAEAIKNSAHPLKSSSRNLCNSQLADVAEILENKSKKIIQGELSFADISAEIEQIPGLAIQAKEVLSEYL